MSIAIALIPYAKGVRKTLPRITCSTMLQRCDSKTRLRRRARHPKIRRAKFVASGKQRHEAQHDNYIIHSALLVNAVASLFRHRVPVVISSSNPRVKSEATCPAVGETRWRTWRYSRCHRVVSDHRCQSIRSVRFLVRVSVNREHVDDAKGERRPLPASGIAQTHIPVHRDSSSPLVAHRIRDCIP